MPNWCVGTLRVKGDKENLIRFFKDTLRMQGGTDRVPDSCFDEDEIWLGGLGSIRLLGLRRCTVDNDYIFFSNCGDGVFVAALDCQIAWAFQAADILELAIKYKVDFRVYGFEMGMEFNQDIEVINGEITKDNDIEYKGCNYVWDCIMPNLGG